MKLTKKLEKEVLDAYIAYWDCYINGDVEKIVSILDDDITMIGSTADEFYNRKEEVISFFEFSKQEMAGKVDFRNREIFISALDASFLVREKFDLYILVGDDWTFYANTRCSSVMRKLENGWKLIHQHGSFPDSNVTEGETIAFQKIEKENIELRDAVKRRTVELEQKNRELEIEMALEKVRAIALSMKEPNDMLQVCFIICGQLQLLGVKEIRNVQTAIFHESQGNYINYEYYAKHEKLLTTLVDYNLHPEHAAFANQMLKGAGEFYTHHFEGQRLQDWYEYQKSTPQFADTFLETAPSLNYYMYSMGVVVLGISTYEPMKDTEMNLFRRFRNVFELAYRRYADIEKAEAQAREARLETALERIRAVAMAMSKSDDVINVCEVMYKELVALEFANIRNAQIALKNEGKQSYFICAYSGSDRILLQEAPYNSSPIVKDLYDELEKSTEAFYQREFSGKQFEDWRRWRESLSPLSDAREMAASSMCFYLFSIGKGHLGISTFNAITPEQVEILKRFKNVFELCYTRYTDVAKAEAQAKEVQIELSLERVRARTMAMQKSEELREVVGTLYEQLQTLDFKYGACTITIMDEQTGDMDWWMSGFGKKEYAESYHVSYFDHAGYLDQLAPWKNGENYAAIEITGSEKLKYDAVIFNQTDFKRLPDEAIKTMTQLERVVFSMAYMKYGALSWGPGPISSENALILQRFAKVFEQTYTRFLDLQKAEAQAKDAQIEAALERVRSRSMGMQKSEELREIIQVVYRQFVLLNIAIEHTGFIMDYKMRTDMHIWLADRNEIPSEISIPYFDSPHWNSFNEARKKGGNFFTNHLNFEEKNKFYQTLFTHIPDLPEDKKEYYFNCAGLDISTVLLENIGLYIENFSGIIYSDEENNILLRFGKVFQQTYTRFLDLQKAESQAREAQIEAALERVRSKAMAMHKSDDLNTAATTVFEELDKLKLGTLRCGIGLVDKHRKTAELWSATKSDKGTILQVSGQESMEIHPLLLGSYNSWLRQEEFSYELHGEDLQNYYRALDDTDFNLPEEAKKFSTDKDELRQYFFTINFPAGGLFSFRTTPFPEEAKAVLRRFASVVNLTYKRFQDIQKAEAQTKEAQIEAALERVRSRTLAMQKSDELAETAAVLFKQLIILGIAPNRLYIGIVNDESNIEFWVTDEDGSKVSKMFSGNASSNLSMKKIYDGWVAKEESIIIDMQGQELADYFHYLGEELQVPFKSGLSLTRRIQYIAYFSKGFIGMTSPDPQPQETIDLLERFSSVFNLTFTRFNDLKLAEAHAVQAEEDLVKLQTEKRRAEDALTELQAAQKQLIQSEKMASLGELTAGIAHEIQNPLNFVNNFSEVSKELLDEMKVELEHGNAEDAWQIANDIIQNLEKINHHGKRADAIVKGMLQHSQSSSGNKEPIDINALADEYIRLCYHGLRAKDNSFNATIKTDFESNLEKVNIISQDIGRAILNILTNAFYAVNEKKKLNPNAYQPTVSVSTKKINGKVEIRISDNGNGIPAKVLDKIFQPFFTTKPTGQGTGLGLSLSYDIITKGHGGDLKVETKEASPDDPVGRGEGATFIIQLPAY